MKTGIIIFCMSCYDFSNISAMEKNHKNKIIKNCNIALSIKARMSATKSVLYYRFES